jgi:hypothetical protein
MKLNLERGFEAATERALLDDAESRLVGQQANLIFQFIELVHTRLRTYARRNDYDVDSTIDSLATPEVSRREDSVEIVVGWESEQMARWEFGVSPHTIDGDPVLSFVWEDPPQWVREEFDQARSSGGEFRSGWRVFFDNVNWGSDTGGIPASRAIRESLRGLREVLNG